MAQQIPLSDQASALQPELDAARDDHTHEIVPDVAYRRLGIVNVVFVVNTGAGDREWVLIDAGLAGTADLIRDAAPMPWLCSSRRCMGRRCTSQPTGRPLKSP